MNGQKPNTRHRHDQQKPLLRRNLRGEGTGLFDAQIGQSVSGRHAAGGAVGARGTAIAGSVALAFKRMSRFRWRWKIVLLGEGRGWVDSGRALTLRGVTRAARRAIARDIRHREIIYTRGDALS